MESKKRIVTNIHNLSPELLEALKRKYPHGWTDQMIRVDKGPGDFFYAVVLETDEASYLIKVDVKIDGGQMEEEEDKEDYDDDIKGAEEIADSEGDGDSDDE